MSSGAAALEPVSPDRPQIALAPGRSTAGLLRLRTLFDGAIWLAVFAGGFVVFEPSPYELILVAVMPLSFLAGLPVRRSSGWLLALVIMFAVGGLLAVTQVSPDLFRDGLVYVAITLFLGITAFWFAALVADDWRRIRIVERATVAAGIVVALIGILAYFRLLPGSEQFLLYDRARATFKDPNVFGPYLSLPALILARRLLVEGIRTSPATMLALMVLVLGVFLSFSRAAWGLLLVSQALLIIIVAANAPSNRDRLRIVAIVVTGVAAIGALVALAATSPAVQDVLVQRAKLVQDYDERDGAELGRFARHWAGFMIAVERPLGLGPFEFPRKFVEATHNSYLKALIEYGWLGFAAYVTLIAATVRRALPLLIQPKPWQGFAQCVVACFLVHLAVGWLIDTDHWRHMFMMIGLIWGLASARWAPGQPGPGSEPHQFPRRRRQARLPGGRTDVISGPPSRPA